MSFSALFSTLLAGCGFSVSSFKKDCSLDVVFVQGEGYSLKKEVFSVQPGEDCTCDIEIEDGYYFASCDYQGDYHTEADTGKITLTLDDVFYPCRISVETKILDSVILYDPNGGTILSQNGLDHLTQYVTAGYPVRQNTLRGNELLKKEGYSLVGWNTKKDGSGKHVSLGSRVDPSDINDRLYAEWKKWTDDSLFHYRFLDENNIALVSYSGEKENLNLVIPETIDGYTVTTIDSEFLRNANGEYLVIPQSITSLARRAFISCNYKTCYFSDKVEEIYDSSLPKIQTIYINADMAPKCQGEGFDNAQFAQNMDRLISHHNDKKLIFFAGCSMSYGLQSDLIQEKYPDYTIFDMGFNGTIPISYQIDCISQYLQEGDIFIHAPEEMSSYQLMGNESFDPRCFTSLEGDYDLISTCDISSYTKFFSSFSLFNAMRKNLPDSSYDEHNPDYNEYGDIVIQRADSRNGTTFGLETCYDVTLVNETNMTKLKSEYQKLTDAGAKILFSYAPLNKDAISTEEKNQRSWSQYQNNIDTYLSPTRISDVTSFQFSSEYFYDSDYHMSTEGAKKRTRQLLTDMTNYIP